MFEVLERPAEWSEGVLYFWDYEDSHDLVAEREGLLALGDALEEDQAKRRRLEEIEATLRDRPASELRPLDMETYNQLRAKAPELRMPFKAQGRGRNSQIVAQGDGLANETRFHIRVIEEYCIRHHNFAVRRRLPGGGKTVERIEDPAGFAAALRHAGAELATVREDLVQALLDTAHLEAGLGEGFAFSPRS